MIHNNFRKYVKKYFGVTANTIKGWTDTNGYTGGDSDTLTDSGYFKLFGSSSWSAWSSQTLSQIKAFSGTTNNLGTPYGFIGTSTENEQDYTFGSFASDTGILTTTARTLSGGNLIITSTITNNTASAVTYDEIGLFGHCFGGVWNGTSSAKAEFLFIKEKLSELQTLEAGASIAVTFNLFADEPEIVSISENS